ncbi:MAG: ABC transporter substrate-binding protein [Gammaproteobacteria bacterium]|nr:ABC transporter substrate-binding protein [Gammaproteobacteria bacterium]
MSKQMADYRSWLMFTVLLALCSVIPTATLAAEDVQTPLQVVTKTVDGVIAVLAQGETSENTKKRQVKNIIGQHFDFVAMSNRVLATNWSKATKEQRARFTGLFRELLSNTYWRKISGFSNEKVEYLGERMRSDKLATVNTVIKTDSVDIPVDYKLYRKGDTWMAYDIVIEQVSLVRNYRGSFQNIVRDVGIDGLISQLETKVAEASTDEQAQQRLVR